MVTPLCVLADAPRAPAPGSLGLAAHLPSGPACVPVPALPMWLLHSLASGTHRSLKRPVIRIRLPVLSRSFPLAASITKGHSVLLCCFICDPAVSFQEMRNQACPVPQPCPAHGSESGIYKLLKDLGGIQACPLATCLCASVSPVRQVPLAAGLPGSRGCTGWVADNRQASLPQNS